MTIKKESVYDSLPNIRSVFPKSIDQFKNLGHTIDEFIIDKRIPPFFRKTSRFYTQGSCFAEHLHKSLVSKGYASHWSKWVEDINSPLALACVYASLKPDDPEAQVIKECDIAVITVGVAPCWFSKKDDSFVLNNTLNLREIEGYYQRTLTVDEQRTCLLNALGALKAINPGVRLVLTLSPVPLARTFEFHSALVADAVSKSVLRAAIHEAVTLQPGIMYFPSFEIVAWAGRYRGDAFGADEKSARHVSSFYIDAVLDAFIRHYQIAETA